MKIAFPMKAIQMFSKLRGMMNKAPSQKQEGVSALSGITETPENYKLEAYFDDGALKFNIKPKDSLVVEEDLVKGEFYQNYRLNRRLVKPEYSDRVVCIAYNGKE